MTLLVEVKWQPLSEVNPEREYIAFSEMGSLKSRRHFFSWMMRGRKVSEQLKTTKGIVGYTVRLGFWKNEGVMLAVFEDEKTLMDFAHSGQHVQCMAKGKTEIGKWMMDRWSIAGSAVPPTIPDAINRLQSKK